MFEKEEINKFVSSASSPDDGALGDSAAKIKKIEEFINVFFQKTSFDIEIDWIKAEEQVVSVGIKTDMPQILIGEGGQTLSEIQRLLRLAMKKLFQDPFYLDLDINNYKKQKKEYLKELAKSAADEVALFKKEKELPPMPAFERRIIHTALSERSDVISESVGEGSDRRVVIKPRS